MTSVAGKKVLITGAAMGMGKLYAQRAVRENAAAVVLWDIDEIDLKQTAAELEAAGGRVHPYVVDVSRLEAIEAAAARVRQEVGDIEILINNAGVVRGKYFWEHEHRPDTHFTMSVNTLAPMYITREFLPAMMASRTECRIVTMASAAGLVANPRMSVYAASKWAAIGWSDSLRLELKQAGYKHIKVTTVCPSYVSTGMFEGAKGPLLTPILTPEAVVDAVWKKMKRGTPFVLMPWTVRLAKAFNGVLPIGPRDFISDRIFGVYHSMDHFTGHHPQG